MTTYTVYPDIRLSPITLTQNPPEIGENHLYLHWSNMLRGVSFRHIYYLLIFTYASQNRSKQFVFQYTVSYNQSSTVMGIIFVGISTTLEYQEGSGWSSSLSNKVLWVGNTKDSCAWDPLWATIFAGHWSSICVPPITTVLQREQHRLWIAYCSWLLHYSRSRIVLPLFQSFLAFLSLLSHYLCSFLIDPSLTCFMPLSLYHTTIVLLMRGTIKHRWQEKNERKAKKEI